MRALSSSAAHSTSSGRREVLMSGRHGSLFWRRADVDRGVLLVATPTPFGSVLVPLRVVNFKDDGLPPHDALGPVAPACRVEPLGEVILRQQPEELGAG